MCAKENTTSYLLADLHERNREFNCLYRIEEILSSPDTGLEEAFLKIVEVLPSGSSFHDICFAKLAYRGKQYTIPSFKESNTFIKSEIIFQGKQLGAVWLYYTQTLPEKDEGPFSQDERRLLNTVADRLGHFIFHHTIKPHFEALENKKKKLNSSNKYNWMVILDLLRATDQKLFFRIARKMMNYLVYHGIDEAMPLLQNLGTSYAGKSETVSDLNKPRKRSTISNLLKLSGETFQVASRHFSDKEISTLIEKWINQDKSIALLQTLESQNSSLSDISEALAKFIHSVPDIAELPDSVTIGIKVSLLRRFFTDQLEYINVAKNNLEIRDFASVIKRTIHSTHSHGKVGGKSAGLLLAIKILENRKDKEPAIGEVKMPKTWYISSDALLEFLHYNNLEDVIEQKYKDLEQIRLEHSHIEQLFKNSYFPPEILRGISEALENFGEKPLIVRSSSLLEDRLGSAFSGKYKSLFIPNTGTFEERLEQLADAIAEVYASTFGPDPIEYRAKMGLLDFNEEMGIMIMEVIGEKIGKYYLPHYAGVAFSNNEFRWSPRIKREDGLLRMVPGLGTRAVDRTGDDYPILAAPGNPGLRINVTIDETIRYSPHYLDVINLETQTFETVSTDEFIKENGALLPRINRYVSVIRHGHLERISDLETDFGGGNFIFNFEGLLSDGSFLPKLKAILRTLQEELGTPVDVEFASDGKDFYLLQCRPQSHGKSERPEAIPDDLPQEDIIFSASKFISTGRVEDITHIVYVDPSGYGSLKNREELSQIGTIISKLNKLLKERSFILMGPGRWGSRGDIKLGVKVSYADINNCKVLIEIARKQGNYQPDLSFGTHFFQDLVEASIKYLPLYPDEEGNVFNETFLLNSPNLLGTLLPEYEKYDKVVKIIDVPAVRDGKILKIVLNGDLNKALAFITGTTESLK